MVIGILRAIFCGLLLSSWQAAVIAQEQALPSLPKGMLLRTLPAQLFAKQSQASAELVFEETFENSGLGWTSSGSWAIGAPASEPGSGYNSARCAGTNLVGNYPDNADDWLISPAITLPATNAASPLTLHFMEWFELESGYDYGFVKISTDGGATWNSLSVRDGASTWRLSQVGLTHYAGLSIKLAFHLTSDGSRTYSGWYLDGIQIVHNIAVPLEAAMTSLNSQNFPFIFMNIAVSAEGQPLGHLTQSNFTAFENGVLQNDYFNVIPPEISGGVRLADIVFVLDVSTSMADEINAVKSNMIDFMNALTGSDIDYRVGFLVYANDNYVYNDGNLYDARNAVIAVINNITLDEHGVGRNNTLIPEDGFDALYAASLMNFRAGAQKVLILITDAPCHYAQDRLDYPELDEGELTDFTLAEITAQLNGQNIACFVIGPNDVTSSGTLTYGTFIDRFPNYAGQFSGPGSLSSQTNARFYVITNDFREIVQDIATTVGDNYVITYQSSNPRLDGTLRTVLVRVTHGTDAATATGSYIPGAAPAIHRTAATLALHDQAWPQGTSFLIEAEIVDNAAPLVQEARVYYKRTSEAAYSSAALSWYAGNVYRASIPGSAAAAPGLDYYLTASDGVSTSSDPRTNPAGNPHQIAVLPNFAPVITHTPVTRLTPGTPIAIAAGMVDHTNSLLSAKLFYRKTGQLLYQRQEMSLNSGNQYEAAIPADHATMAGVDYYLAAEDDLGVGSTHGSADQPHQIIYENDQTFRGDRDVYFYPNPYNPFAGPGTFRYTSRFSPQVTIKLFDAANIWIRTILAGAQGAGDFNLSATWDGSTGRGEIVGNGVYFYVIESSSGARAMGKIAVLR